MIIPKELAQAFIEDIDTAFLAYNGNSGDKDYYLSHATSHMKSAFNISWSKGGTWCNCWGDKGIVDEEDEPEPEALNKFLSKYYSQLSDENKSYILSYMEEDDEYDSDYYGGRTVKGHKSLTFKALADVLTDLFYKVDGEYKVGVELINLDDLLEEHSNLVIHISLEDYPKFKLHKELDKTVTNEKDSSKRLKI